MLWTCDDCTITNEENSIVVSNRFVDPQIFQLSTDLYVKEGQNVRLTIEWVDYVADIGQNNAFARTSIEAFLDYGDNIISAKTNMTCFNDCLKGKFEGNLGWFDYSDSIS